MRDLSCVLSGYCCTVAPCIPYGKSGKDGVCIYLMKPDNKGQRECQKYPEIIAAEQNSLVPMMGSGCSSTLFNTARDTVIANLKRQS